LKRPLARKRIGQYGEICGFFLPPSYYLAHKLAKKTKRRLAIVSFGGLLVGVFGTLILASFAFESEWGSLRKYDVDILHGGNVYEAEKGYNISTGSYCRLIDNGKNRTPVSVAEDRDAFDELTKLYRAENTILVKQLYATGRIFKAEPYTKVLILDSKNQDPMYQVRILEGSHKGKIGWVESYDVRNRIGVFSAFINSFKED
jgi:hypothetical protein